MFKGKTDIEKGARVVFFRAGAPSLLAGQLVELELKAKEQRGGIAKLLEGYRDFSALCKAALETIYTESWSLEEPEIGERSNDDFLHFYRGNKVDLNLEMPVIPAFFDAENLIARKVRDIIQPIHLHNLRGVVENGAQDMFLNLFNEMPKQNPAVAAFFPPCCSCGGGIGSGDDLFVSQPDGNIAREYFLRGLGAGKPDLHNFFEPLLYKSVSCTGRAHNTFLNVFTAGSYIRPLRLSCRTGVGRYTETDILMEMSDPEVTLREELRKIYERNYDELRVPVFRVSKTPELSDDVKQETYFALSSCSRERDLRSKTDDNLLAYLLKTVKNSLTNRTIENRSGSYGRMAFVESRKNALDAEEGAENENLFNFSDFFSDEAEQQCIDGNGVWRDEPEPGATEGELDRFYEHSKNCPYHQSLMEKEEKDLSRTLRTLEAVFESDKDDKDDKDDRPLRHSVIGWKGNLPIIYKFPDASNKHIKSFLEKVKDSLAAAFPAYTIVCVFSIGIAKSQAALLFFSLSSLAEDKGVSVVSHYITDTEMCQFQASFEIIADLEQLYDISHDFKNHIGISSCRIYNKVDNMLSRKIQDEDNEIW